MRLSIDASLVVGLGIDISAIGHSKLAPPQLRAVTQSIGAQQIIVEATHSEVLRLESVLKGYVPSSISLEEQDSDVRIYIFL